MADQPTKIIPRRPQPTQTPAASLPMFLQRLAKRANDAGLFLEVTAGSPQRDPESGETLYGPVVYQIPWHVSDLPANEVAAELYSACAAEAELTDDPQLYTLTVQPGGGGEVIATTRIRVEGPRNAGGALAPRTPMDQVAQAHRHAEQFATIARNTLQGAAKVVAEMGGSMTEAMREIREENKELRGREKETLRELGEVRKQEREDAMLAKRIEGQEKRRTMIAGAAVRGLGKLAPQLGRKIAMLGGPNAAKLGEVQQLAQQLVEVYGKLSPETVARFEKDLSPEDQEKLGDILEKAAKLASGGGDEDDASDAEDESGEATRH